MPKDREQQNIVLFFSLKEIGEQWVLEFKFLGVKNPSLVYFLYMTLGKRKINFTVIRINKKHVSHKSLKET